MFHFPGQEVLAGQKGKWYSILSQENPIMLLILPRVVSMYSNGKLCFHYYSTSETEQSSTICFSKHPTFSISQRLARSTGELSHNTHQTASRVKEVMWSRASSHSTCPQFALGLNGQMSFYFHLLPTRWYDDGRLAWWYFTFLFFWCQGVLWGVEFPPHTASCRWRLLGVKLVCFIFLLLLPSPGVIRV